MRIVTQEEAPGTVPADAVCANCEHAANDHRIEISLSVSGEMVCPYLETESVVEHRCIGHVTETGEWVPSVGPSGWGCSCPNFVAA